MANRKLIEKNSYEVSKFFEFRDPTIMKGTAGSYFSLEADRRSESRVTMSERGHKSLDCEENAHFRRHVKPILQRLENLPIYKPAKFLEHDPTALRRWRAGETKNDVERMRDFDRLCKFVAVQLDQMWPGLKVFFIINPQDEEFVGTPRQANDQKRTWDKFHSYRLIGAEVERVMIEEGCGADAAKGLVSQRTNKKLGTPCSFSRAHQAWLFWQSEKKEAS